MPVSPCLVMLLGGSNHRPNAGACKEPTASPWRQHRGQPVYPVRPELTVEVRLLEWTALGQGRHMSYKGVGGWGSAGRRTPL